LTELYNIHAFLRMSPDAAAQQSLNESRITIFDNGVDTECRTVTQHQSGSTNQAAPIRHRRHPFTIDLGLLYVPQMSQ
jgi:hypothetical protein